MRGIWRAALVMVVALFAVTARAEADPRAQLYEALGIGDILEVMQAEGASFGAQVGEDFLANGGGTTWRAIVNRIYSPEAMEQSVLAGLDRELPDSAIAPLVAFFTGDIGKRIVAQEILARRAFLDSDTEEAARAQYRDAVEDGVFKERVALVRAYVEANDLVEFNVAGALNSNLRFYRGLSEGGAVEMTEDEMLSDVWEQEDETRSDTDEWLMAYLMMAYAPLSDDDLQAYVDLSKTPAGKALNKALFAGFDGMYADVSFALGLAVSSQMRGQDL